MFAIFSPKKVALQDLKIIIFLFVGIDCFTIHNLDPHFFDEKWAFKNKARLLFSKTSFSKVYQMFALFFPKKKWRCRILKSLFVCLLVMTVFSTHLSVGCVKEHPLMMSWNFTDQLKPYSNQRVITPLTKVPKNNVETLLCVILNIQQNFNFLFLSFPGAQR